MNRFPPAMQAARPIVFLCALSTVAALAHGQNAQNPATSVLRWSNGRTTTVSAQSARTLAQRLDGLTGQEARHILVHFAQPVEPSDRAALGAMGLELTTALGGTSYFASLRPGADHGGLSRASISSVSAITRQQKLHRDLEQGIYRAWMIDHGALATSARGASLLESGVVRQDELDELGVDPEVAVVAMLHPDVARAPALKQIAARLGGRVVREIESINAASLLVRASQVGSLADLDAVMWVEPPLPALSENNAQNRALTGVDLVNSAPYALSGEGVSVLVYDGGKAFAHEDFGARLTIGSSDTSPVSGHATHVAGTLGGDGTGNREHRGMAPSVQIVSYGFEAPGGLMPGFLYTDPGDIEADYLEAYTLYGVDLTNNSIGSNIESNLYDCAWQGDYGATSALIDSIARGAMGAPLRVIWAAGNERQGSRCDVEGFGDFYSIAPPAGAKNHISVGSVDADTDGVSSFSSWGPTDDGRIKPDVSAPGCQYGGDSAVTSTYLQGYYTTLCGTSMAAPTASGICAMILEQHRLTFPDRPDPMNATLKALLANTAVDRGRPGPDFEYGYGSIRATGAIDAVASKNIAEGDVAQGEIYRAVVVVGPGEAELRVTAAWDDAPAAPNVVGALVNDLDLRVIDTLGTAHMPWTLDPSAPSADAIQTARDGRNNIEQVSIPNPAPGVYVVEVVGFNIAQGPSQTFGLASSSTLIGRSSAGVVRFGRPAYPCAGAGAGTGSVLLVDRDLNTSDNTTDTVDVVLESSATAGAPIVLTLTETSADSAAFGAEFTYASSPGSDLIVADGGTITAAYVDANDGKGNSDVAATASARIDCAPATASSVGFSEIRPRSARIDITLASPASVTVYLGESPTSMGRTVVSNRFSGFHSLLLDGLRDDTTYYASVMTTDEAGNSAMHDNGGDGHRFTTPFMPDFFTEEFTAGFDLEGLTLTLKPAGTIDGYEAYVSELAGGALPFEPTDGQPVAFSGFDDSVFVPITGGESVTLFGEAYTGIHIGTNGYITLGAPDTQWNNLVMNHFNLPRVSAFFNDLNPILSGTVHHQQLADRMVISYDEVTTIFPVNANTFQIELHFDGTIVMSWERIESERALVGVSAGLGIDSQYLESDLSSYPAPPSCLADFDGDGALSFFDVSAFIGAYNASDPAADLNGDGVLSFFDVSVFVSAYNAGCP